MPTPEEIQAAMTAKGGWTKRQLARWGVPWPPPQGWPERLAQGLPIEAPRTAGRRTVKATSTPLTARLAGDIHFMLDERELSVADLAEAERVLRERDGEGASALYRGRMRLRPRHRGSPAFRCGMGHVAPRARLVVGGEGIVVAECKECGAGAEPTEPRRESSILALLMASQLMAFGFPTDRRAQGWASPCPCCQHDMDTGWDAAVTGVRAQESWRFGWEPSQRGLLVMRCDAGCNVSRLWELAGFSVPYEHSCVATRTCWDWSEDG